MDYYSPSIVPGDAIAHLVIGVRDLNEALALWVETFGYEAVVRKTGADKPLARMWGLDAERIVAQALVGTPGIRTGRLHFVQFADPLPPVREHAATTDLVPKNIDIVCRELPQRYDELRRAGHRFRSPYVRYKAGGHDVYEVQMQAHDCVNISMIEFLDRAYPYTAAGYAGMTNFVPIVPDADAEVAFYRTVLGLPPHSTHLLTGPEIEKMIGLPPGAALDIRILGSSENFFGRVELINYRGIESFNRYPAAKPPALGILHAAFFTSSMAELHRRAAAAQVELTDHGLVETIFGAGAACTVFTPAGLRLDIHERP